MTHWLRAGVGAVGLAVLLWAGARPLGPLPPLGRLLDPVRGVWALGHQPDVPDGIAVPQLTDSVRVVFDDRMVPHVFARNTQDAWRAVGYLHAYHRLFQMEMQTRAAAGRLSEWNADLLDLDRSARAIGLPWAAERDWAALDTTSREGRWILAYAEGVNARIDALRPEDVPLEYRLLGADPEPWHSLNTFLFAKRMGETLSYEDSDLAYERFAEGFGAEVADALSPVHAPIQSPMVPTAWPQPRVRREWRLPDVSRRGGEAASRPEEDDVRRQASNNWVVHGSRTVSGHPLLAGDPHLDMSLPSVWYEVHVVVPDSLDVYGVSFPGSPGVLIGFTTDVAWAFTNTGADAVDFWNEVLDDPAAPTAYRLDGEWNRLERRIETYWGPDGVELAQDTLYYTHRGPLVREDGRDRSMRWTVLEPQGFFEALVSMLSAKAVVEWLQAAAVIRAPAQNGVVADRHGDIAIISAGAYPIRAGTGDGRVIRDGTTRSTDWLGFLPVASWPYVRNPSQGFLASANQEPLDPNADPTYFGSNWPSPWRAMRINALLGADTAVTSEAMSRYQNDPGSARADWFVPAFIAAGQRAGGTAGGAADLLARWDRRYTRDNEYAVLFELAMGALRRAVWDELDVGEGRRAWAPGDPYLAALLADSAHPWWDVRETQRVETRDNVLAASLATALDTAVARYGQPGAGAWRWEHINRANIWHLLRLPALSTRGVPVQGGPGLVNPVSGSGTHGPSWRMVVEMSASRRAWSIYPGGQSGNPLSARYADRIPAWADGQLEEVRLPRRPEELPPEQRARP